MKKSLFFLTTLCFIVSCIPKDSSKWSYTRERRYENSIKCTLGTKYTAEQRRETFPFNKAKKVLFISYQNREFGIETVKWDTFIGSDGTPIILSNIDQEVCELKKNNKKWGYLDTDTSQKFKIYPNYCAIESVEFNANQVDTLSNILLNYQLNKTPLNHFSVACYTPRNAILFLNEKNQVVALIEICFECFQMKFSYGEDYPLICDCHCGVRLEAVRELFANYGIKYGITNRH
ncbi:MAG: hypothetical protein JNL70_01695 [Saprospiraceae bacterium]|nr:hypothetical protein [Saprospiraceae bacterium]